MLILIYKVTSILRLQRLWDELKLGYTEMTGSPMLREEIAGIHGVTKDEVLVAVPQEGIYIAMRCLVDYLKRYVVQYFKSKSRWLVLR